MLERNTLKNGIKVIAKRNSGIPTISTIVAVRTGSRNEEVGFEGISHFLEHINFKGTAKRNSIEISKEIDAMGAESNASTDKEITNFYIKSDNRHFEKTLDILSDITFRSVFPKDEMEKEKGAVIEEFNMYEDTPLYLVPDLFEQIVFDNLYLAQPVLGKKETILSMTREKVIQYREKYYKGDNIVISVAGHLPDDYLERIEKYFSFVSKGGEMYLGGNPQNSLFGKNVYLQNRKTEQAHIVFGCRSYSMHDKPKFAARLLALLLGGNSSSRLYNEIREKRGLAYYINSITDEGYDNGIFRVRAGLNVDKTEEAVKIIRAELERAKNDITEEDIERVKEFVAGAMPISEEDSMNQAAINSIFEIYGVQPMELEERLERYRKVTASEVKEAAKELLKPENLRIAVIGPFSNETKFAKILED